MLHFVPELYSIEEEKCNGEHQKTRAPRHMSLDDLLYPDKIRMGVKDQDDSDSGTDSEGEGDEWTLEERKNCDEEGAK